MPSAKKSPLAHHRQRMKQQGLVRVEVRVRKEDAALIRSLASALFDPSSETKTRALLRQGLEPAPHRSLKALLAAAPLDGIELEREQDMGRTVDL